MNDLVLPDVGKIIKDTIKTDMDCDCRLIKLSHTDDYMIYVNELTGSRYLVQVSQTYDLFGQQDYREDYPQADTYIYIGSQFIFIQFAEKLIADWKLGQWQQRDGRWWESSLMLFENIGGIIYDWRSGVLVDKDIEK